jgi:serine/alanine adding enzyme
MGIKVFSESDRKRWDVFVLGADGSCCYHLIAWKDMIEKSFGHKTHYLLSEDDQGNVDGVLPLAHLRSRLFGSFMVSLPYFNYGGICAKDPQVAEALRRQAVEIAREGGAGHIEFRYVARDGGDLPFKLSKVSMRLSLPENDDLLWNRLSSKLRSQVRRPTKEGMRAVFGRAEELDSFYHVFSVNMRDLGTPVYSRQFFRNILDCFPETSWICTVYDKQDKAVASGFLVGFKDVLEIPWASSLREYSRHSPNMLLYWNCLKVACEKGFRVFDFGRSTPGEGTYKFKEQWGAQPVPLHWHYWLRNGGPLPELNPKNPKYQLAIRFWKSLPVGVTRLIGPHVVKYLA